MYKGVLTLLLLFSLILLEYYPVRSLEAMNGTGIDTTPLNCQIFGIVLLGFILLSIIWIIPNPNQEHEPKGKSQKNEDSMKKSAIVGLTEEEKDALKDGTYVKIEDEEREEYAERS